MIFPIPDNINKPEQSPLMWTAVLLNLLLFFMIFASRQDGVLSEKVMDGNSLELAGRVYFSYLGQLSPKKLHQHPQWVLKVEMNRENQRQLLGAYAMRDAKFIKSVAEGLSIKGNIVEVEEWRAKVQWFQKERQKDSIAKYGLSSENQSSLRWLTYQFSHSGAMHLLSNLVFLIILGLAVERIAGSFGFILLYLGGGLVGGWLYLIQSAGSLTPMVGASASISALLGFYVVAEVRKRIRYFYMLAPLEGYFGPIYLPTLLIVPLFLVVDLSSLLSSMDGMGSQVAYSAHLGGALFGLLVGSIYRYAIAGSRFFNKPI